MSNPIPPKTRSSLNRLIAAKAIRGFGDGFVSLLLPVYLLNLGLTAFQVGLIATTTLRRCRGYFTAPSASTPASLSD